MKMKVKTWGRGMKSKELLPNLSTLSIPVLARLISHDWARPSHTAAPYLAAMHLLYRLDQQVGNRDGYSVVARFLHHAQVWKGAVAVEIKAELTRRLKQ